MRTHHALFGWLRREDVRFVCPECGKRYRDYFDGNDCECGKINLCKSCFQKNHSHKTEALK